MSGGHERGGVGKGRRLRGPRGLDAGHSPAGAAGRADADAVRRRPLLRARGDWRRGVRVPRGLLGAGLSLLRIVRREAAVRPRRAEIFARWSMVFATYFKRTPPPVRRCKNQHERRSYGRETGRTFAGSGLRATSRRPSTRRSQRWTAGKPRTTRRRPSWRSGTRCYAPRTAARTARLGRVASPFARRRADKSGRRGRGARTVRGAPAGTRRAARRRRRRGSGGDAPRPGDSGDRGYRTTTRAGVDLRHHPFLGTVDFAALRARTLVSPLAPLCAARGAGLDPDPKPFDEFLASAEPAAPAAVLQFRSY